MAKNAPKKRGIWIFLELYARKFWQLAIAGVLWTLTCVPILTRGLADAGLTFISRSFSREKHAFVRQDYAETIRKNWRPALISGIINQLTTCVLLFNIVYYSLRLNPALYLFLGYSAEQVQKIPVYELGKVDKIIIALTLMVYGMFTWMKYYIPFLIITFKLRLKQVYKNAFFFAAINLKRNLLISVILIGVYALLFGTVVLFASTQFASLALAMVLLVALTVLPAFRSFLIQYNIFPAIKRLIIDPYYKENPGADRQARLDLNLEVEQAPADAPLAELTAADNEPVFVDTVPAQAKKADKPEKAGRAATKPLPRQYNETELRRFNRQVQSRAGAEDDDDTI